MEEWIDTLSSDGGGTLMVIVNKVRLEVTEFEVRPTQGRPGWWPWGWHGQHFGRNMRFPGGNRRGNFTVLVHVRNSTAYTVSPPGGWCWDETPPIKDIKKDWNVHVPKGFHQLTLRNITYKQFKKKTHFVDFVKTDVLPEDGTAGHDHLFSTLVARHASSFRSSSCLACTLFPAVRRPLCAEKARSNAEGRSLVAWMSSSTSLELKLNH